MHLRKRCAVTGGAGFLVLTSVRGFSRRATMSCVLIISTREQGNIVHLLDNPYFELHRHDITYPLYVEVEEVFNLACPASRSIPERSGADHQGQCARFPSTCWDWRKG